MREKLNIVEDALRLCVQEHYGVQPATLEFLPLGLDTRTAVYRVVSEHGGNCYLLKVKSGVLYEPSYLVPRALYDQGITTVVAPLFTKDQTLWTYLDECLVILYPFIDGVVERDTMTAAHWRDVGTTFRRIHQAALPASGCGTLRKETFDPAATYTSWVHTFEAHHLHIETDTSAAGRALRSAWHAHRSVIHSMLSSLEQRAQQLREQAGPYVICHADLHAHNLIRDAANRVYVIDWEDVMLAPKERDFIFVRGPEAEGFWEGYGQQTIDQTALAYYYTERLVQDLIEDARNACLRDDLTEETRAEAVQWFHATLRQCPG